MQLICYGAAGTVTGSCHMLKTEDYNILIDCGFFQGGKLFNRNEDEFLFDPADVDFLLITHDTSTTSGECLCWSSAALRGGSSARWRPTIWLA